MRAEDVTEVRPGVFAVRGGGMVEWYLLRDGRDLTLVDAGYPGQAGDVRASVSLLGHRLEDVRAVLVTHAHADHLGAVGPLQAAHGTPAFAGAADASRARSGSLQQVAVGAVLRAAWRPGVAPWAVRALRLGGTRVPALPHVQPLPGAGPLDLPGRPVPVPTPGHTPGHTAYHLPEQGVVLTGDALVTAHPTSRRRGPQLLPPYFDHDRHGARSALAVLGALDADTVLPGHGPPAHGATADLVQQALHHDERSQRRSG